MRALAIICAYNEADILPWTLKHLKENGVDTHVIDNESTDNTAKIAAEFGSVETFPREERPSLWRLLTRVEEVAAGAEHDWIIHQDADEIRIPPLDRMDPPVETIIQALEAVPDQFMAIDHRVLTWQANQGWPGDCNPLPWFMVYGTSSDDTATYYAGQIKCWRNLGRVYIADSGGHRPRGIKPHQIYPLKWTLHHFPLRSEAQAQRKIKLERNWCEEERAKGAHVHYSHLDLTRPLIGQRPVS